MEQEFGSELSAGRSTPVVPRSAFRAPRSSHWRSLEELADTEGFRDFLHREFPRGASEFADPLGRRRFLQLMGASLALAGLAACGGPPREKIVPYVRQPEELVPGKPLFFATAVPLGGYALGVLVESHEGRPTKVEGNPDHPASLGATDTFAQAAILTLYDPDRSQAVIRSGRISSWDAFLGALLPALDEQRGKEGAGLRVLTETVTSPTLAAQLRDLLGRFPAAKWHQYEPAGRDNARAGARLAFGEDAEAVYRFENADVIAALDADFLQHRPGSVRYARAFIDKRRVRLRQTGMSRLYAVECTPALTGAMADHRLALRAGEVEGFARALARDLGVDAGPAPEPTADQVRWRAALARDLQARQGAGLVLAGEGQPPVVHALAHAINEKLGNAGRTVVYTAPVEARPVDQVASLRDLVADMAAGRVDLLLILGGNPAYAAPADLAFAEQLQRVKLRVHLGLYEDETAPLCHWHIPEAHPFETWGDARAYDGTATIMQPLIAPLYAGRSAHEVLSAFLEQPVRSSYEVVRGYWQGQHPGADFEQFWQRSLHDGVVAGTASPPKQLTVRGGFPSQAAPAPPGQSGGQGLEIVFRPDPMVWDGRFANNAWLQELPRPLTKLTWDNAALTSPATAARLGLGGDDIYKDVVELRHGGRTVRAPVWITPGHADDSVTVHLGYGRTRAGRVGNGAGFNAYAVRTADAPWFAGGLEARKTGTTYPLASTQHHASMEGRDIVQGGTIEQFRQDPNLLRTPHGLETRAQPSLYPQYPYNGYAWGMSIDLNACIGCAACTIACQAENNIPIVGKERVIAGREMHWIRVDRYYAGDVAQPDTDFQPVPCMHCETAPCELVCPVAATTHSAEGLNEMTYNRCIGTRYCSNNCPYKVRRFNFFQFSDKETPSLKLGRNPDVTVRDRGVMEKCTYCVQRINRARITAEEEGRTIRDGELKTACQQACPTNAIVFGDLNDTNSQVARLKAEPLDYTLLVELNTRPRTTYMARLRNPNPDLEV